MKVVSFFSGCGGFDLGFKQAGYDILLANDNWKPAVESYKKNFPETTFLDKDIKNIKKEALVKSLKEKNTDKIDIVIGGPPCQCFTRLNNNNLRKDDERNQLFKEYIRLIRILKPDYVVMENVADLLVRKNLKNQYFKDMISKAFNKAGYKVDFKVFDTEKYGVPQKRRRIIFLASSKENVKLSFPKEDKKIPNVEEFLDKLKKYKNLKNHEFRENGPEVLERIKHVPQGGYYNHLPEHLKVKKVRNGELVTVKRYGSYFRRLHPKEAAITLTSNYVIHPYEDRYLTNREKATLHTFPHNFIFSGGLEDTCQQIANAVPPEFARRIAEHIKREIVC